MTKNLPRGYENESRKDTMAFIDSKRNWDYVTQQYRRGKESEHCTANLSDCKIYWRGEYLILEHDDLIHYWDSPPYCFLEKAVEFMDLDNPADWKTLDKLIALRMGIRQTEVNLCAYVEDFLMGETMTLDLYTKFMRVARRQDLQHHGSHTF